MIKLWQQYYIVLNKNQQRELRNIRKLILKDKITDGEVKPSREYIIYENMVLLLLKNISHPSLNNRLTTTHLSLHPNNHTPTNHIQTHIPNNTYQTRTYYSKKILQPSTYTNNPLSYHFIKSTQQQNLLPSNFNKILLTPQLHK